MKEKILSIISLVTIFVPLTMLFVWKPTAANATAIAIGYGVFIVASFLYALFLFLKKTATRYLCKSWIGCKCLLSTWDIIYGYNPTSFLKFKI